MADKIFNALRYFPDLQEKYPNSEYVPGMLRLIPNKDNRLHLQVFVQDDSDVFADDDNEQASWVPYNGEVTTLFNTDIPCNETAPLAFIDAEGMFNQKNSPCLSNLMGDLGLGYEVLSYSASKHNVYPPVYKLDIKALAEYDEAGVNRFINHKPVTHVSTEEERKGLRYSDKFDFMGQIHMDHSYEAYANTLVFKTPYQIKGEDVYMMVNNYALERPEDPYNFQLYTANISREEVDELFNGPDTFALSNDFGGWVIPRNTLDFMPREIFTYSDATRGAENHPSFNEPIVDTLTDKVVSKEDITKEIQDYIKTFHFELFFKYSSTDRQKETQKKGLSSKIETDEIDFIPDEIELDEIELDPEIDIGDDMEL